MLKADRFRSDGSMILTEDEGQQQNSDHNANNSHHRFDDAMTFHTAKDLQIPTFKDQLSIPKDLLTRIVKNKTEMTTLTRISNMAIELDELLDQYSSLMQCEDLKESTSIPSSHSSGFPPHISPTQVGNVYQTESNHIENKETSHQPLSNGPDFAELTPSSPCRDNHQIMDIDKKLDPLHKDTLNNQSAGSSKDDEFRSILRRMITILAELRNVKTSIATYQDINRSLIEELMTANCPELAQQKQTLCNAEELLKNRLEKLFSDGTPFHLYSIPWEPSGDTMSSHHQAERTTYEGKS